MLLEQHFLPLVDSHLLTTIGFRINSWRPIYTFKDGLGGPIRQFSHISRWIPSRWLISGKEAVAFSGQFYRHIHCLIVYYAKSVRSQIKGDTQRLTVSTIRLIVKVICDLIQISGKFTDLSRSLYQRKESNLYLWFMRPTRYHCATLIIASNTMEHTRRLFFNFLYDKYKTSKWQFDRIFATNVEMVVRQNIYQ